MMAKQPRGPELGRSVRGTSAGRRLARGKAASARGKTPAAKPDGAAATKALKRKTKPETGPRKSKAQKGTKVAKAQSKAASRAASADEKAARVRKALLLAAEDELHAEARAKAGKPAKRALAKITINVHKLVDKLIDEIAAESGVRRDELLIEAINLLLMAYNKKPIA